MSKLTPKQAKFVTEYLKDLNATQAAIRAGYSSNGAEAAGSRLLANVKVAAAVKVKQKKIEEKSDLSIQSILTDLETIKARCLEAEPVLDREGEPSGEYKFNSQGALKACELQGKHLGMFTDKVQLTGKDGGPIQTTAVINIEFIDGKK